MNITHFALAALVTVVGMVGWGFWLMWRCGWSKGKGPSL